VLSEAASVRTLESNDSARKDHMTIKPPKHAGSRQGREAYIRMLTAKVASMTTDSAPADFSPRDWVARWLKTPHPALGNLTPGSLMDTDDGRRLVMGLLGQIEAGSYA
jgi:uncharacterized protein (DUF2384 family)